MCSKGVCVGAITGFGGGTCQDACGADGQPCCMGPGGGGATECSTGLGCIMNKCTACGATGQDCCPNVGGGGATRCDTGNACSMGKCAACGNPGDPCCPAVGGPGNDGCPGPENNCVQGKCQGTLCGVEGQACCEVPDGSPANAECPSLQGTLKCINDKCTACGQVGEPCCIPLGPGGDGCVPQNAMCVSGTCQMM
jgi:hypothetical protein